MDSPLYQEVPWISPVQAFAPFAGMRGAILFESSRQMPTFGRYSFIAVDPFAWWEWEEPTAALWPFLKGQLAQYPLATLPDLPPFQGGLAGLFSYELAHTLERLSRAHRDAAHFPECMIGAYDVAFAFDHLLQRTFVFSSGYPEQDPTLRQKRAQMRLAWGIQQLAQTPPLTPFSSAPWMGAVQIHARSDKPTYEGLVEQALEYIRAGDIFEVNLTQQWSTPWPSDKSAFDLYRRLRQVNPAPFAGLIHGTDATLISASPERFIQLAGQKLATYPIKGTARRGATPEADQAAAAALAASPKDRAENIMIVDLMRNDFSRICQPHSVQVEKLCQLESFETVHHLVSTVTGTLKDRHGAIEVLEATFPGGSITGAPKIRSMEIITTLEKDARGPYCGSLGYIGFDGAMDTSIVIRSFSLRNDILRYQTGGAIVYDSVPAQEYQEVLDKAAALTRALIGVVDDSGN